MAMRSTSSSIGGRCRQVGQPLGQLVSCGCLAPQAHQAGQLLAGGDGALGRRAPTPAVGFRLERLFARQVELAGVAGARHPVGQLGARFGRRAHLPGIHLPCPAATASKQARRVSAACRSIWSATSSLVCSKRRRFDALRQRRGQHADETEGQRALDVDVAALMGALK